MMRNAARLHNALVEAGIPIIGVSSDSRGLDPVPPDPDSPRILYAPEATPEQCAQGDAIASLFDWSEAADRAWELQQSQRDAKRAYKHGGDRLIRAVVALWVEEQNRISDDLVRQLNRMRRALVPPLPDLPQSAFPLRSKADVVAALETKVDEDDP